MITLVDIRASSVLERMACILGTARELGSPKCLLRQAQGLCCNPRGHMPGPAPHPGWAEPDPSPREKEWFTSSKINYFYEVEPELRNKPKLADDTLPADLKLSKQNPLKKIKSTIMRC